MNRKFSIIGFLTGLLIILSSCSSDNLKPILTFDQVGKGAYVRLITETARELDLQNLGTSNYEYTVEFVDIEQGALITQFDINVSFVDKNPDNGDKSAPFKLFKSFSSSEFTTDEAGFKSITVSIPLSELLSLFSLSTDDIKANDQFRIDSEITDINGSVFNAANSSAAVNGTAFQGHFAFTLKATCPMDDTQFTGTYLVTYVAGAEPSGDFGPAFGADPGTVTVSTVSGSTTKRSFQLVYLVDLGLGNGSSTITVEFVCDAVVLAGPVDAGGLSCGGNEISTGVGPPSPVDINDNSHFQINLIEFEDDGGCGTSKAPFSMLLTKQ